MLSGIKCNFYPAVRVVVAEPAGEAAARGGGAADQGGQGPTAATAAAAAATTAAAGEGPAGEGEQDQSRAGGPQPAVPEQVSYIQFWISAVQINVN